MNANFRKAWLQQLDEMTRDLDLSGAEDRALFRSRVAERTAYLKFDGLKAIARMLGRPPGRSRFAAVRAIARGWIERRELPPSPETTP